MGRTDFSDQFLEIIKSHKRTGFDSNVMRQSACFAIIHSWLIVLLHSLISRREIGPLTL